MRKRRGDAPDGQEVGFAADTDLPVFHHNARASGGNSSGFRSANSISRRIVPLAGSMAISP